MEPVVSRWASKEPRYRVTKVGVDQLWELVASDRLETSEQIALCLALSELESARRAKVADCASVVR